MSVILLEQLIISALAAEGIKASTTESVDWTGDYVVINRSGWTSELFGSSLTGWGGREEVEIEFNLFSSSNLNALNFLYRVEEICRNLSETYSAVSNVAVFSAFPLPVFNDQHGYTFGLSATVKKNRNP